MSNQTKAEKQNIKQLVSILVWALKTSFKMTPVFFTGSIITKILSSITPIGITFISSRLLGNIVSIISSKSLSINSDIINLLIFLFLLSAISQINSLLDNYIYMRQQYIYDKSLTEIYLNKIAEIDFQHHENPEIKTIEKKAKESINWRFQNLSWYFSYLISTVISLILIAGILFTLSPILILLIFIPVLLSFLVNRKFGKDIYGIWGFKGNEKKEAEHASAGLDNNDILFESKIYNFAPYIINKYSKAHQSFINAVVVSMSKKNLFLSLIAILDNIIFVLIQYWLILQVIASKISISNYTFYLSSINTVSQNLSRLEDNISRMYESLNFVSDLKYILELKPILKIPKNPIEISYYPPEIEFKNVSFKYPKSKTYILKDLSFKINPGEKIALVGKNGAGKSTLIKLLARFYDATSGEVLINGNNIKDIDLKMYYGLMGVLFQKFAHYWFTLRENIGLGNIKDIENMELIEKASQRIDLSSIISKLSEKYENMLSTDFPNGKDLSGGEWQKIGLARGIFADPQLIILDEPTSAIDALAEEQIFKEINERIQNKTMIIVSHRFATVRNANKILVLDKGRIVEQGSHNELIKNKGLYYQMFTSQAKGYK